MREPVLIAEVGCNHLGELDIAKRFVEVARNFCEIDHVKFQKRENRQLLSPEQYDAPHPVPENSFGSTYGAHREFLEFTVEEHAELKQYCDDRSVVYSCSVWDLPSLQAISSLGPEYIKIPSATNSNLELLETAARTFDGKIHVSLGMTTREEEHEILSVFRDCGRAQDVVLYACTSGYPIRPPDACLLEIPRLVDTYGDEVEGIGYSGHHLGISLDVVAYTLGATFIERHFTLDRTWKGTDHAASLEPDGMRRVWRDLVHAHQALRPKESEVLDVERAQRAKLKWVPRAQSAPTS